MGKTTVAVELEREDLSYLIDYILEDLRAWSEKGFESGEEGQFQRIVSIVSKLRDAVGENEIIFI